MTNNLGSMAGIRATIKGLNGATVRIFGQPQKLDRRPTADEPTIDIIDIIDSLSEYEVNVDEFFEGYEDEDGEKIIDTTDTNAVLDELYNLGYINNVYDRADNSYNWLAPVSHHFNFETYPSYNGGVYIVFSVHQFGDVRGNYTDDAILYFDSIDEFYEAIAENNKYLTIDIDGVSYDVEVNVFCDGFEVWNADGGYVCTAYGYDLEDIADNIREKIA